ncbi:hypothetical protein BOO86_13210 [Mycobacterium sp. CBMA 234]|uniref:hypothetical protein n=1 Tax=Mycolicibacterium sp. CBMA 234 TaxID=1918495 RepID=UPI0012DD7EA8|nr:hypothetical protein [Mycolicibacterium sp. CBMA 234]MUL65430.1 hypothetical protein [Mycolicibacterium sp. CBMA 234]
MTTIGSHTNRIFAAATLASAIAIPLVAGLLAAPASAYTNPTEPPDPCVTAFCQPVRPALNPQPLPPGIAVHVPPRSASAF